MILARIILGLLSMSPMSGYDIKRHFDTTINHFWSADKAQIYRALSTLVSDGFATAHVIAGDMAPDRVEHRLTRAGRAELKAWLQAEVERQPERDAFLARLFFADAMDDVSLRALLAARRAKLEGLLEVWESTRTAHESSTTSGNRFRMATLDNGIAHARAELAWLDGVQA